MTDQFASALKTSELNIAYLLGQMDAISLRVRTADEVRYFVEKGRDGIDGLSGAEEQATQKILSGETNGGVNIL